MAKRIYTIRVEVDDDDLLRHRKPDHMKRMPDGTPMDVHKRRLREQRKRTQRVIDGKVIH